jgi:hypothetical protein
MFIPSYQIHNIIKDFTQQLKNGNHRPDACHRLETVVNKVAVTIMSRVTRLSQEEARLRTQITDGRNSVRPTRTADKRQPTTFHYHTFDENDRKLKNCLSVENSEQLINRFLSMIETTASDPPDE